MKIIKGNIAHAATPEKVSVLEGGCIVLRDDGTIDALLAKAPESYSAEVIDYGDGVYAIGFKDGKVHKNLLPTGKATTKAVTVTLNIYLEGNQTTKANTTASVKLTIVK